MSVTSLAESKKKDFSIFHVTLYGLDLVLGFGPVNKCLTSLQSPARIGLPGKITSRNFIKRNIF